jgi:Tol biopolymer transport system component
LGWGPPEYLAAINSAFEEGSASLFEDETTGITYLYFSSNRTDLGGPGDMDMYVSTLQPDETWGSPVLVSELSSSAFDNHPVIRRDGLEIFFISNRCGSLLNAKGAPSNDIWTSTRASSSDPWSPPVNIDADPSGVTVCLNMPPVKTNVNTGRHDGKPSLSFDGTTLYFGAAQRPANLGVGCPYAGTCFFDLWVTTREKLRGRDGDKQ